MYDTAEYANSRLMDTIVRHNGEPIRVHDCFNISRGNIGVNFHYVHDSRNNDCPLVNLDLTPVPLGMSWSSRGMAYLARIPKRSDYRQGLRNSNFKSLTRIDHRHVSDRELVKTIKGRYVPFDTALDEVMNTPDMSIAFNRHFALVNDRHWRVTLEYKWHGIVGTVVEGLVTLDEPFQHLQETLDGAIQ